MVAVLGISAYHGDSAAALIVDGSLAGAVAEERFTRVKHWAGFPSESVRSCLDMAGLDPWAIDHFAVARDPRAHLVRKALYALVHRPSLGLLRDRARNRRRVTDVASVLADALDLPAKHVRSRIQWVEHHPAHLASAFFVSPWEEAAVCAIDGFGDFVSTSWGVGSGRQLRGLGRIHFPHSLGMFYLALTQYLGFHRYGDEYKVMGLAAYGAPDFAAKLRGLIRLNDKSGGFELDLGYFRHHTGGVEMTWEGGEPVIGRVWSEELERLLGPARRPDEPLEPRHEAIAASAQAVFEEAAFHVLRGVHRRTGLKRLALAGGCALNSVMNGKIREQTPFTDLCIQPAAGDDGTALGAALSVWHERLGYGRTFTMEHGAWGPAFDAAAVHDAVASRAGELERAGCRRQELEHIEDCARWAAERVAQGQVVGWYQGRAEWGARALGHRSIVADPRRADMRDIINTKIKMRERFRPFAPSILEESLDDWFVGAVPDPFMVQVYPVRPDKRALIPAVTHVDGTGRLQTVGRSASPEYWQLIKAFEKLSGVPVLLNTSFNENEPIVLTPLQALDCFLRTRMDALVLGATVIEKGA